MSRVYRTIDGDVLDAICKRELGTETFASDVLKANPGLAALGTHYPAGIEITFPDSPEPVIRGQIRLWGRT